eukprot:TRINITY_DN3708_c0_g1_i1.p1 TRINITY_DN3708_c0_g1~~TRINITY_DN3708_c0_g1_i1.p1  ORF type:complete len:642 (+),score=321.51 TRINITY_DN3708_c0_g1_i1:1347-3272(+)
MKLKKLQEASDMEGHPIIVTEEWLSTCVAELKLMDPHTLEESGVCLHNLPEETERDKRRRKADAVELTKAQARAAKNEEEEEANEDSQRTAARRAALASGKKVLKNKGGVPVEPDSELDETHHVFIPRPNEVYSVTLNYVDLSRKKNSYYIMQILQPDKGDKNRVTLYRKWGRIGGEQGADTSEEIPSTSAAIRAFSKLFKEKTKNDFSSVAAGEFEPKPGAHRLVHVDYSVKTGDDLDAEPAELKDYDGPLDAQTKKFVELIFDVKQMHSLLAEMEIDTKKMPLGKISRDALKDGMKVLKRIQSYVTEIGEERVKEIASGEAAENLQEEKLSKKKRDEAEAEIRAIKMKLQGLSAEFYTAVPHNETDTAEALLDEVDKVTKKNELVQNLMDVEIVTRLMRGGKGAGTHPVDNHFDSLKVDMSSVEKKSPLFKDINTYLQNTHAATHKMYSLEIDALWEIERPGETEKFESFMKKHKLDETMLLWHGSRLTNWGGILSQGLRIAPPEAPTTGYMFGKGVYFADMSSKSANYCFTNSEKTTGVMVLCEVALGAPKVCTHSDYIETLPKGKLSCFGKGATRPDPKGSITYEDRMVIPCGKSQQLGEHTSLRYNEFIVYNTDQIRMRYLLQLNFKYNGKHGTFF